MVGRPRRTSSYAEVPKIASTGTQAVAGRSPTRSPRRLIIYTVGVRRADHLWALPPQGEVSLAPEYREPRSLRPFSEQLGVAMSRRVRMAFVVAILLILLARTAFFSTLSPRLDNVFLVLLGAVAVVALLPLERLTNLTLGSVAVTLDSPQVAGALSASLDRVADESLRRRLESRQDDLAVLQGSRVLWIDDHPNEVLGERRILRALGVEVTTTPSSLGATGILKRDGDFDLLVTDVQREGTSYEKTGGVPLHEGTNYIEALRRELVPELAGVPSVRNIPVIFYAAYDHSRLMEFTRRARELEPMSQATSDLETFLGAAIFSLADSRRNPIVAPVRKRPT